MFPNSDFLFFGSGVFLAGFLSLRLPETHKKPMPETVADLYDLAGQGQSQKVSEKEKMFVELNDAEMREQSDAEYEV